jgi:tRNA A37 threonylcarbamoyladenosine dehydratase
MSIKKSIFQRTELLLGKEKLDKLSEKKVIIFGIGGVGSWCAESLVRTGICKLTIVDSDRISVTNINRQLHATTKTVGAVKVNVLRERLLEINPHAEITAIQKIYSKETHDFFRLDSYDYIIDAIDSLASKIHLIRMATRTNAVFFSSMGASLKLDPTKIQVAEFWKVHGCPLGSMLRKKIHRGDLPAKEFLCVFSNEVLENKGEHLESSMDPFIFPKSDDAPGDPELINHDWSTKKARINGTTVHITAIFGFTLAGMVIQSIYQKD